MVTGEQREVTKIRIHLWERARNGTLFIRDFIDFHIKKPLSYDDGVQLSGYTISPPKDGMLTIEVIE